MLFGLGTLEISIIVGIAALLFGRKLIVKVIKEGFSIKRSVNTALSDEKDLSAKEKSEQRDDVVDETINKFDTTIKSSTSNTTIQNKL